MDQRLFRIAGHRPRCMTNQDVPALAKAMVAYVRKQVRLNKYAIREVMCLHFHGAGVDVLVRSDDWAKVVPYLRDGSFSPLVVPVSQANVLHRDVHFDVSTLDVKDDELYSRYVRILDVIFPEV